MPPGRSGLRIGCSVQLCSSAHVKHTLLRITLSSAPIGPNLNSEVRIKRIKVNKKRKIMEKKKKKVKSQLLDCSLNHFIYKEL